MKKKILFISGSIGLGHFARGLSIADELRKLKPDCEIVWLTEEPASHAIKEAGEKVIDENCGHFNETFNLLPNESPRFNVGMSFYDWYRSKMKEDFTHQMAIIEKEKPDVIIGDEAFALFVGLEDNLALFTRPIIFMWDFIKSYPMSNNPMEHLVIWMMNRKWLTFTNKWNQIPSGAIIFLLPENNIPNERLGLFLMDTKEAILKNKSTYFVGFPLQFNPNDYRDGVALKKSLGYSKEPLIMCAVGGTHFGKALLNLCGKAYPLIKKQIPDAKMVLVTGPLIDPKSLNVPDGIEVRGYVPKLYEHFAACDLAIVLGGGTSTLELAALKRPFIYFPLEDHAEQKVVVAQRNERYNAGIKMNFPKTTPEVLAQAVVSNIGKMVEYLDMPLDGCKKAAEVIAKFV